MSAELWHAILNPRGPNYERLKDIFPENRVPLQSPGSIKADLGAEKEVEVYMLNLSVVGQFRFPQGRFSIPSVS